jgi:hypothetical protein
VTTPRWLRIASGIGAISFAHPEIIPIPNPSFGSLTGSDPANFDANGTLLPGHFSSFESPHFPVEFLSAHPVPNWLVAGNAGIIAPLLGEGEQFQLSRLPKGRQILFLPSFGPVGQILPQVFRAGLRCTLKVDMGRPRNIETFNAWEVTLGTLDKSIVFDAGALQVPPGDFRTLMLNYSVLEGDAAVNQQIMVMLSRPSNGPVCFDRVELTFEPAGGPLASIAPAVAVSWASGANEWCRVERAARLSSPDWTPITAPEKGTGPQMRHFEVASGDVSCFRVIPVLPP